MKENSIFIDAYTLWGLWPIKGSGLILRVAEHGRNGSRLNHFKPLDPGSNPYDSYH